MTHPQDKESDVVYCCQDCNIGPQQWALTTSCSNCGHKFCNACDFLRTDSHVSQLEVTDEGESSVLLTEDTESSRTYQGLGVQRVHREQSQIGPSSFSPTERSDQAESASITSAPEFPKRNRPDTSATWKKTFVSTTLLESLVEEECGTHMNDDFVTSQIRNVHFHFRYLASVEFSIASDTQYEAMNTLKIKIEKLTKEKWNWRPLKPVRYPLKDGECWIQWTCTCRQLCWANVPLTFAQNLVKLCNETNSGELGIIDHPLPIVSNPQKPASNIQSQLVSQPVQAAQDTQPSGSGHSSRGPTGAVSLRNNGLFPSSSQGQPQASHQQHSQQQQQPAGSATQSGGRPSQQSTQPPKNFVFLLVRGKRLKLSTIVLDYATTSAVFFKTLRREYLTSRGWARSWLSVWHYSHCDFDSFYHYGSGKHPAIQTEHAYPPPPTDREYEFNPKPMDHIPRISYDEFQFWFHACYNIHHNRCWHWLSSCERPDDSEVDALGPLPKSKRDVSHFLNSRAELWGLYAREQIYLYRVLVWNAVCLLPGILWLFLWIYAWKHPADVQNGQVLLVLMATLLAMFWPLFLGSIHRKPRGVF